MIYKFIVVLLICLFSVLYSLREYFNVLHDTVLVVQFDTRLNNNLDDDIKILMNRNVKRCRQDLYCEYYSSDDDLGISPYWAKVKHIYNHIGNNNHKYIMWLDTDAVIDLPSDKKLVNFIDDHIEDKDMLISSDMPPWKIEDSFNAGVWVVRNNKNCKKIVKEWLDMYRNDLWIKNDNKWKTSVGSDEWSTCPAYEQGCFNNYIYPKYKDSIKKVSWTILNNPNLNDRNVIHHFAGEHKRNISKFLHSS